MSPTVEVPAKSRRRFWPRFTLRLLLVAVTVVAIALAFWTHRAREQARIVKLIEAGGGMVCYERDGPAAPEPRSFVVEWLAERLGRDYFEGVTTAFVYDRKLVRELKALQGLDSLSVFDETTCDDDLAMLSRLNQLRYVRIGDGNPFDAKLPQSQISDRSLRVIARLPRLEIAHLQGTGFSSEGIKSLRELPLLSDLQIGLCNDSVTARDFDEMKRSGHVRTLIAWRTGGPERSVEKIVEW